MQKFMAKRRPAVEIRHELDLGFEVDGQSVVIFEIRPAFHGPKLILKPPVAKATFVRNSDEWKVYWMRANGKWVGYEPCPFVDRLEDFLELVDEDGYCCFWG